MIVKAPKKESHAHYCYALDAISFLVLAYVSLNLYLSKKDSFFFGFALHSEKLIFLLIPLTH